MQDGFGRFGETPSSGGRCGNVPEGAAFGVYTGSVLLPAFGPLVAGISTPAVLVDTQVNPESRGVEWPRCITARTTDGRPFDLEVTWAQGGLGQMGPMVLTAPSGFLRLFLPATSLRLRAAAWDNVASMLTIGISDRDGQNQDPRRVIGYRQIPGGPGALVQLDTRIPAFARSVECVCSNTAQLANILVIIGVAGGVDVVTFPGNAGPVPIPPVPMGAAGVGVWVQNNNAAAVGSLYLSYALEW